MVGLGEPTERPRSPAGRRTTLALLGALLAAGAFTSTTGLAAGLAGASRSLGSAGAAVARCDPDGFSVVQNLSGTNVVSLTVGGIAAGCGGGTMQVTLHNGSASSTGSATVPGGGGSLTVSLAPSIAATVAERVDIAVTGP